jgi:diaminohydroxyphosphoribosylaminopyrimidine deaminase/5-amino-6-(5-phosphoribosylamino)uracil reductase
VWDVRGSGSELVELGAGRAVEPGSSRAFSAVDQAHMAHAFELARHGRGLASPNPLVGAVVVAPDGSVAGEGWHEGPGTPHAEISALRAAGDRARGGTLYVTLEPCGHHGRTPPCAPAVARAGIARVVASVRDPNPLVDGSGLAALVAANVSVDVGLLAAEGSGLIEAFAKAITTGTPFVTLKVAMSLDGKVAARDGSSRWITGAPAREDVHRLRAEHDAVMVGAGTAIADDPSLTVRSVEHRGRQPIRIVVDGAGRMPARGRLFDGAAPIWVLTSASSSSEVRGAWEAAGASVWVAPGGPVVRLADVMPAFAEHAEQPLRSILIEGGPTLAWSAIREGIVDRFVFYVAPKVIGGQGAASAVGGDGIASIAEAVPLEIEAVDRIGEDLRVLARPPIPGPCAGGGA